MVAKKNLLSTVSLLLLAMAALFARAFGESAIAYIQPPNPLGTYYQSSSNGSDYDQFVWDNFTVQSSVTITAVEWFGVFDPAKSGAGGVVTNFKISIYGSQAAGTQPDVTNSPLMEFMTSGNAQESLGGQYGSVNWYTYHTILPSAFKADSGKIYWLQIEAIQNGISDWCIVSGTGKDSTHFRRISLGGDISYQSVPGDAAFALLSQSASLGNSVVKKENTFQSGHAKLYRVYCSPLKNMVSGISPERTLSIVDLQGRTVAQGRVSQIKTSQSNVSPAFLVERIAK